MKHKSFDHGKDNNEDYLRSNMLHRLYTKFKRVHPGMSGAESFITFFVIMDFEELQELVEQEREEVGKAQFDLIMVVIEAFEILNGRGANFK